MTTAAGRGASAFPRRRLLGVSGAAMLGGCGSSGASEPRGAGRTGDFGVLSGALDVERRTVAAYQAAASHLSGGDGALARRVLDQERRHVAALEGLVRELRVAVPGGAAPAPPLRPGRDAALAALVRLEEVSLAYYVDALPKLSAPLRTTVAAIAAADAEHAAVVRMALGLPGAPAPFVWGAP